jgi:hypothetical protein
MGQMAGLAICHQASEGAFYLFGCDADWQSVTDTWHQTVEDAKHQAEFEYEGVNKTWKRKPLRMWIFAFRSFVGR